MWTHPRGLRLRVGCVVYIVVFIVSRAHSQCGQKQKNQAGCFVRSSAEHWANKWPAWPSHVLELTLAWDYFRITFIVYYLWKLYDCVGEIIVEVNYDCLRLIVVWMWWNIVILPRRTVQIDIEINLNMQYLTNQPNHESHRRDKAMFTDTWLSVFHWTCFVSIYERSSLIDMISVRIVILLWFRNKIRKKNVILKTNRTNSRPRKSYVEKDSDLILFDWLQSMQIQSNRKNIRIHIQGLIGCFVFKQFVFWNVVVRKIPDTVFVMRMVFRCSTSAEMPECQHAKLSHRTSLYRL